MDTETATSNELLYPLARIGRLGNDILSYLGDLGLLVPASARALVHPEVPSRRLLAAVSGHWDWMLLMVTPLVVLVHVAMGSSLAMQAYFGGTFADGTGAVVGVGLVRNFAPLMTGILMAGMMAAKYVSELRAGSLVGLDEDPSSVPDRDVVRGDRPDDRVAPDPHRLAAVRMLAGAVACPVFSLLGVIVGTVVGWLIAARMLGIGTHEYFGMFAAMLWTRDVVGLGLKGAAFGLIGALFACHEGLRGGAKPGSASVPAAACRAASFSAAAILVVNSCWFLLAYHGGPAFGPTLMTPPGR
ncbi:ABC transporter permease [Isosphaeraceae bacterium EP7]